MASNPLHTARRRFFQKFGVAFFWALVFGLLLGGASYFRVERHTLEDDPRWHVVLRLWLEVAEAWTYDWRAKELGAESVRSDEVVLVHVDQETLASARESDHPEWAVRPWPRALSARVVEQALKEGASVVLFEQRLGDVSPYTCAPCRGERTQSDDERLAETLHRNEGKVVLTWRTLSETPRPAERMLTTTLLKIGSYDGEAAALDAVGEVHQRRADAFLLPAGDKLAVWAGATSEDAARDLAAAMRLGPAPEIRSRTPRDDDFEISDAALAVRLARVSVAGVDPERVLRVRTVEAPVSQVQSGKLPAGPARVVADSDGVVRAVPLLVGASDGRTRHELVAAAPLRAVMLLAGSDVLRFDGTRLHIGERFSVPMNANGFVDLAWDADAPGRGGRGTLKRDVSAWRLLVNAEDDAKGNVRHHDNALSGRVVVFVDEQNAGFPPVTTPVGRMSHAAVSAQAIAGMLKSRGISRVPPQVDFWLTIAFAFTGAVLAVAWSSLLRRPGWLAWVLTLVGVFSLHALVARQLLVQQERWVAMAAPLLACSLTFLASLGYARTLEQGLREFMTRALGGMVRADVFRRVERNLQVMRPERRPLTVYFSDIEGFTSVAHEQPARDVVLVLQDYLAAMTGIVLDASGYVDKYLGDGLMAFWGAPVELPDHPAVACEAALKMQERFATRKAQWEKKCGRPLVLRAGMAMGTTLVGEMGTFHRVNYTVMGEPVATAFRLEAMAKKYGARILVGDQIAAAVSDRFWLREVDLVRLSRQDAPMRLFELLGRRAEKPELGPELEAWSNAIAAFREGRFHEAKQHFKAMEEGKGDKLAASYAVRCDYLELNPPMEGWDGVYEGPEP